MAEYVQSFASKGSDEETGKRTDRKRVRDGKVCALCGDYVVEGRKRGFE